MPTGYTSIAIKKGFDLEQFALLCSRAFGATLLMRDEPLDAPIPEKFEASTYNADELVKARAALAKAEGLTLSEKQAKGESLKREHIAHHIEWLTKEQATNDYLAKLRTAVADWTPPSSDHEELKKFMLQQIDASVEDVAYIEKEIDAAEGKSAIEFFTEHVESLRWNVDCHTKGDREERERAEKRTLWVKQLRASFE